MSRQCPAVSTLVILTCLFIVSTNFFNSSEALAKTPVVAVPKAGPPMTGVWGVVKTDGAMVYRSPDFDADVLGNLHQGQSVVISRTTFGEFAKFYKIKFKQNMHSIIGYVADIDVKPSTAPGATGSAGTGAVSKVPSGGAAGATPAASADAQAAAKLVADKKKKAKKAEREKRIKAKQDSTPMYFSRFVGLVGGQTSYKESFGGVSAQQALTVYGLKITGPDVLIKGPIVDLSFLLHYGAPDYYKAYSKTKPTGFILWSDALLLLPFFQQQNAVGYFGIGPALILSDFKLINSGVAKDLFALNLGASLEMGAAVRIARAALRLEAKYTWEKQRYMTYLGAVQMPF
jgi:hypothetical protein